MNKQLIIAEAMIACAIGRLEAAAIDESDQSMVKKINGALLELSNGHSILQNTIDPPFVVDEFETGEMTCEESSH